MFSTNLDIFLRWEYSQQNPKKFYTQDNIVIDYFLPVRDIFREISKYFYITKIQYTNVRLQLFVNQKDVQLALDKMSEKFYDLVLLNKPTPEILKIVSSYGPLDLELDFREFLTDITNINLDLHEDISCAKSIACETRVNTKDGKDIQSCLQKYFIQTSDSYNDLVMSTRESVFWERLKYNYDDKTPWNHFFFNPILGFDF